MYKNCLKRIFDFFIASVSFLFLMPIFAVIVAILIVANNGRPFFFQTRPGKGERPFNVIKFKTMNDRRDSEGKLLSDKVRLTGVGQFLRKTSLDEIPQLLNVIKGDMSLVGPRPLLFKYIPLYSASQRRRHEVRPGITGWAQVNGRNSISWTQKFKHDIYYIDNLSFCLDLKILFLTVAKVVKREGINQTEERPMMPFDGSN